ncbi:hypothetical protein Pint_10568 [Pistacia integerrima]|uniref:Uncharacterized protein n=1 Tax=Pistacia integerrima TaxID=434235 RepID=A0ACC0XHW2_9ROSI|nr:hypothetical protein Pint_10568 [Pistacia integerrima]
MEPNTTPQLYPLNLNPSKTQICLQFLLLFTVSFFVTTADSYISNPPIQYSKHCNHIVPEYPLDPTNSLSHSSYLDSLRLSIAFFSGGDPFFNSNQIDWPNSVAFRPRFGRTTVNNTVLSVEARLNLVISRKYDADSVGFQKLRQVNVRGPNNPVRRGVASFRLSGFWSEADGKLCMVGSGSSHLNSGKLGTFNAVLKLIYSKHLNLSVFDTLVSGLLESLDVESSGSYFKPLSILGVVQFNDRNYEFGLIDKEIGDELVDRNDKEKSLSLDILDQGVCSVLGLYNFNFDLEYGRDCDSDNVRCNPLRGIVGNAPGLMSFKGIRCVDKGKMQILLGFWNSTFRGARFPFDPHTTMVAEGAWDEKKNQLRGVACRILNFTESLTNAYIGDCSVKLSLRFPAVFSLRNRSTILGQIWSSKRENDPGYFSKIGFGSTREVLAGLPGFKYQYTVVDIAKKSCVSKNSAKHKGKRYPNGQSIDMRFDTSLRNSEGQTARGFSSPLFIGDELYEHQLPAHIHLPSSLKQAASVFQPSNQSNILDISYKMSFAPAFRFKFGSGEISETVEISAEGVYYRDTGVLCMIGCRKLGSSHRKEKMAKNDSLDCEIAINIQFRALDAEGSDNVKGSIVSTREKSDSLYFGHLQLSSNLIYASQAKESIWRMDLEITMVLISNTLACVFVALQLFYVKKHPEVLPVISVVMLIILTLRYMVPLLLNFEALVKTDHNQQNVFLGSGGWLESNEIIVRVVMMVAFLLQFRLLQLTWSARQGDGSQKDLWISEKKVLYVSLPLYIVGCLIAWVVYQSRNTYHRPYIINRHTRTNRWPSYQQHSLWGDLKSYVGLVLDGFLLPQILFNLFFNSTEKALAASFYIGTTVVRLLPHAYDLYRAHGSTRYLDLSYIYANHKLDFYSTAWDITIPCGGLLFAALIYLQQQFGGQCILLKRFRQSSVYEKVPVVNSVELQHEPIQKHSYSS